MANVLTPARHLLIRYREILAEALSEEGYCEQAVWQASFLAEQFWCNLTLDKLFACAEEVLPKQLLARLVRFCQCKYPITASSLKLENKHVCLDTPWLM